MTPIGPRLRGRGTRTFAAALVLALLLPLFPPAAALAPVARADDLSASIAAARQRQQQLQRSMQNQQDILGQLNADEGIARTALFSTATQLNAINANQADVRQQVQQATDALHRVQAREDALLQQPRQLDWTLSLLQSQIDQGTEDLQAQQRALGLRLADAYRTQQTSLLEQVIAANSFADVLSQASAYLALGDQDRQMAQSIAQSQQSLDTLRRLTAATRIRTDQLRRDAGALQVQLQHQKAQLAVEQRKLATLEARTQAARNDQLAAFHQINNNQAKANAAIAAQAKAEAQLNTRIAALVKEAQRRAAIQAAREEAARKAAAARRQRS